MILIFFWSRNNPLASCDIQTLKVCTEYGILAYFFEIEYKRANPLGFPHSFILFHFTLHWYFHEHVGYYVEILLIHYIEKDNNEQKELFKESFLRFQKIYYSFFFRDRKITQNEALTAQLVFKKTNLLRLIRVILPIFQPSFWETLTPRQRYFFSANLMALMLEKGTYYYLNAFLDNNTITFTETSVIINEEMFNFNQLNLLKPKNSEASEVQNS